jgi:hypothetical protein
VQEGWNILVGADEEKILEGIQGFNPVTPQHEIFGSGDARKRIAAVIRDWKPVKTREKLN